MKKNVITILLMLIFAFNVNAEEKANLNVKIDQIISEEYPEMTAYVVVRNQKGEVVTGLSPSLFSFRIDSKEIETKTKIMPFSMREEGIDFSIMVSNNGIMEGEPFDFQKNAIMKFVELMGEKDTLSVYTIGEDAGIIVEGVTKKTFDSAVINKMELSESQPRLYDSIMNLVRKVETKKAKRKAIIIISDGRDQNSRFSKDQLAETLSSINIPIYTVGMKVLSNQTLSNLDEISQITCGTYFYSSKVKEIPDKLKKAFDCIKQSFVVEVKVKNVDADNQIHLFEVKIDERDSVGGGMRTFLAVKHPVPKWLKYVFMGIAVFFIAILVVLYFMNKRIKRRRMGITKRSCPDCGFVMKDSWETCPFCLYKPELRARNKKR